VNVLDVKQKNLVSLLNKHEWWIYQIKKLFLWFIISVLCLLGNKSDLDDVREVDRNTAVDYAASIGAIYFETSALSNEGVYRVAFKDGRYFEEITKSDEVHPKVKRFWK
jgi:hypothetical protein